ncbi:MAG: TetR/AcrR family transcriptional regulator [Sphingobacteriales bacterium]|nr:MAG: TetR/AcrR family transcriptional regulator [Sphingobacteriales bacterium]
MSKRKQFIDTAIELFARNGYESTSIQKLADACGVAQGLLYRHFKNKEALLAHLVQMGLAEIGSTLQPYGDPELNFKEAFKKHVQLCCNQLQSSPLLWKILHSVRQNSELMAAVGLDADITEIAKLIMLKLEQDGYSQPKTTALMIIALIDGVTAMHLLHPAAYPLAEVEQFLLQKIDSYE